MSCCGQAKGSAGVRVLSSSAPQESGTVIFEYVGRTALTAIGGATGRRYRFDEPGVRLIVDARDRRSLDASAVLKQVG